MNSLYTELSTQLMSSTRVNPEIFEKRDIVADILGWSSVKDFFGNEGADFKSASYCSSEGVTSCQLSWFIKIHRNSILPTL
ncbi:hypothetical protein R7Q38_09035 [Vibrio sp. Vb0598]|nr:hypothetical protein [Vibrio sp. Vb0598]